MTRTRYFFTILTLGLLTALCPISIDMYLPGFLAIARSLHTQVTEVALSLSGFFVAVAIGQLLYGPLMDRFGRKQPLYIALTIYILFSLACIQVNSVQTLIAFRFLQGLSGCATGVAAMAMVKDIFPEKDTARVISLMMLVIGVSPMLAPALGSFLTSAYSWRSVFVTLALLASLILAATKWVLPENYIPDRSFSLKPNVIAANFVAIMRVPAFFTYSITVALAFAGMFGYVASSPAIFMGFFRISSHAYGLVFAFLSIGMIGASQVNHFLSKYFESKKILLMALSTQLAVASVFFIACLNGWLGLYTTISILFLILCCIGIVNPNATALALSPIKKNAGTASSLMGAIQLVMGSLATYFVSLSKTNSPLPMCIVIFLSSVLAVCILLLQKSR